MCSCCKGNGLKITFILNCITFIVQAHNSIWSTFFSVCFLFSSNSFVIQIQFGYRKSLYNPWTIFITDIYANILCSMYLQKKFVSRDCFAETIYYYFIAACVCIFSSHIKPKKNSILEFHQLSKCLYTNNSTMEWKLPIYQSRLFERQHLTLVYNWKKQITVIYSLVWFTSTWRFSISMLYLYVDFPSIWRKKEKKNTKN